jgi:hypothetical protein
MNQAARAAPLAAALSGSAGDALALLTPPLELLEDAVALLAPPAAAARNIALHRGDDAPQLTAAEACATWDALLAEDTARGYGACGRLSARLARAALAAPPPRRRGSFLRGAVRRPLPHNPRAARAAAAHSPPRRPPVPAVRRRTGR